MFSELKTMAKQNGYFRNVGIPRLAAQRTHQAHKV